jgi:hypothetical protein
VVGDVSDDTVHEEVDDEVDREVSDEEAYEDEDEASHQNYLKFALPKQHAAPARFNIAKFVKEIVAVSFDECLVPFKGKVTGTVYLISQNVTSVKSKCTCRFQKGKT